ARPPPRSRPPGARLHQALTRRPCGPRPRKKSSLCISSPSYLSLQSPSSELPGAAQHSCSTAARPCSTRAGRIRCSFAADAAVPRIESNRAEDDVSPADPRAEGKEEPRCLLSSSTSLLLLRAHAGDGRGLRASSAASYWTHASAPPSLPRL
ncbi:unnamed protein product, partial [Urochloa humidicola]